MKLTAVVVTYNRLSLLKRTVNCLLEQTCPLGQIYIVNNGSTDGTKEWLDSQEQVTVIHQANVGGSGGFYTGIQQAFQDGADWIWCMDDDVFPRPTCLELLLKESNRPHTGILAPRRLLDGKIYTNDFQEYDLTHPFASLTPQSKSKEQLLKDRSSIVMWWTLSVSPTKIFSSSATTPITVFVQSRQDSRFIISPMPSWINNCSSRTTPGPSATRKRNGSDSIRSAMRPTSIIIMVRILA